MFDKFYRALAELDEIKHVMRELQYRSDYAEYQYKTSQEILQSQIDATTDIYEERREEMHPHIHKLTLTQWESMRWMNNEQFEAFKRRNTLLECKCPAGMKYHANNCPAHPGEQQ